MKKPLTDTLFPPFEVSPRAVQGVRRRRPLFVCDAAGAKLWRMAIRFAGRQKLLSFGKYPAVSLAAARKRRDQVKELMAAGIDPSAKAKAEKQERMIAGRNTFAAVADELLEKAEQEGKADVTVAKKRWLVEMAKKSFGG